MMVNLPETKKLSDIKTEFVKGLLYGDSGTGKTIFGAGGPKPIIMLDTDKGTLSIQTSKIISNEDREKISVVEVNDFSAGFPSTNPQGYDICIGVLEEILRTGGYKGTKPALTIADSFTTTSQMCLSKALFLNGRLNQNPQLQDYGTQRRHLEKIIKLGIGLRCHFLAICHEQFMKDEFTGRVWLTPLIVGKLAKEIPLYFDEVYHSKVGVGKDGKPRYEMECSASGMITAKSRLGLVGVQELKWEVVQKVLDELGETKDKGGESAVAQGVIGKVDSKVKDLLNY